MSYELIEVKKCQSSFHQVDNNKNNDTKNRYATFRVFFFEKSRWKTTKDSNFSNEMLQKISVIFNELPLEKDFTF